MANTHSFSPIYNQHAKVLILGSIPGKVSLVQNQYYAHERNTFWRLMSALISIDLAASYDQRVNVLQDHSIALWDVLAMCTRDSSLDSDIVESSIVANDFVTLYGQLPDLTHIFFNGAKAEQCYQRYVYPTLSKNYQELICTRLPSTSPAHAALSFQQKLAVWEKVVSACSPVEST